MKNIKDLSEFNKKFIEYHPGDSGLGGNYPQEPTENVQADPEELKGFILQDRKDVLDMCLSQVLEKLNGLEKEEVVIENCENCGGEGYGKAWYGHGKPNDPHGYGDRYYPLGSVIFCKDCSDNFKIGKEWDGEEIWKRTSDELIHTEIRLNHIQKKVKENIGYNTCLQEVKDIINKLR